MGCVIIRPPSGPLARAYNQGRGKPVEPSSSSLYLHHHHSLHAIAAPVAGKAHLTNNISTLIQNNPPVKRGDKTFALNRSALSSQTAMGAFYDEIPDDDLVKWILDQKIFWVATAPLAKDGHVNVSPKGESLNIALNAGKV